MDHNRLDIGRVDDVVKSFNQILLGKDISLRERYEVTVSMIESWNHWCVYEGQPQEIIHTTQGKPNPFDIMKDWLDRVDMSK